MAASQSGSLSVDQVDNVVRQAGSIALAGEKTVTPIDFVFIAAFDGTGNDAQNPGSIAPGEQSTNVSQLSSQAQKAALSNSNLTPKYYPGPGSEGSLPGSSAIPSQVTQQAENTGRLAYRDFSEAALKWLDKNPGASPSSIKIALTSFSRGVDAAVVFSHLLYEKGLVDESGKVIIPPGQLGISAAVIYDPVATGMQGNLAFAPTTQNMVVIQAENEYRYLFKSVDYSNQVGATTFWMPGNHADIGGGYDNGIGALTLAAATNFFRNAGIALDDVPESRRHEPGTPLVVHDEGVDSYGNRVWDEYGQYPGSGDDRLTMPMAKQASVQINGDGKTVEFDDYANRHVTYQEQHDDNSTTVTMNVEGAPPWRVTIASSNDSWTTTLVDAGKTAIDSPLTAADLQQTADNEPDRPAAPAYEDDTSDSDPDAASPPFTGGPAENPNGQGVEDPVLNGTEDEWTPRATTLHTTSEDGSVQTDYLDWDSDGQWDVIKTSWQDAEGVLHRIHHRSEGKGAVVEEDFIDGNGDGLWEQTNVNVESATESYWLISKFDMFTHALLYRSEQKSDEAGTTLSIDTNGDGSPNYTEVTAGADGKDFVSRETWFRDDGTIEATSQHESAASVETWRQDDNGDGTWETVEQAYWSNEEEYIDEFVRYGSDGQLTEHWMTTDNASMNTSTRLTDSSGAGYWDEKVTTIVPGQEFSTTETSHYDQSGKLLNAELVQSDAEGPVSRRIDRDGDGRWDSFSDRDQGWASYYADSEVGGSVQGSGGDEDTGRVNYSWAPVQVVPLVDAVREAMAGFAPGSAGGGIRYGEQQAAFTPLLGVAE